MTCIELLAPAKDLSSGITAINAGADAVYIGAQKFGARYNASNSLNDIHELIKYAHKFRVKVYITLNTILFDNELEEAVKSIHDLYNIGADAIIIQDMGLLECGLPPIPLFASTQTNNYSLDKIIFLEKAGFRRVILARELSLEQIKKIKDKTNIELEFFIHGSLCVSYSGQCYFSQAITGRSGNRGNCTQPCRMTYDLMDKNGKKILKDKYLLSLKDLNLSGSVFELIEAGITSFKIEGRLKDSNYVTNITAYYRQKIDEYLLKSSQYKRSSLGISDTPFFPNPSKSFNRGFSDYFLHGRKKEIYSPDTEKSIGEPAGIVKRVSKEYFVLEAENVLKNGDGICFFDKEKILKGTKVNISEGEKIFPQNISGLEKGAIIFRNYDAVFEKLLTKQKCIRKINITLIMGETGEGIYLTAIDEENTEVKKEFALKKILPENEEKSLQNIKNQLSKTGDSIYSVKYIEIKLSRSYFFKLSFLNKIRREIIEFLDKKRDETYKREFYTIEPNEFPYPEKELDYKSNIANKKSKEFYERHKSIIKESAFEIQKDVSGKVIMITKHCIKYELGFCPKDMKSGSMNPPEPWYLENNGKKYMLEFDCKECVMHIII